MPEYRERVRVLSQTESERQAISDATNRIIWALNGFGRVPDDFENLGKANA